jgi:hypothetical protein
VATSKRPQFQAKGSALSNALKIYGASLANQRWAVSAIADDGSLVVSCWETYFQKGMRYVDALSRWGDGAAMAFNRVLNTAESPEGGW